MIIYGKDSVTQDELITDITFIDNREIKSRQGH